MTLPPNLQWLLEQDFRVIGVLAFAAGLVLLGCLRRPDKRKQ